MSILEEDLPASELLERILYRQATAVTAVTQPLNGTVRVSGAKNSALKLLAAALLAALTATLALSVSFLLTLLISLLPAALLVVLASTFPALLATLALLAALGRGRLAPAALLALVPLGLVARGGLARPATAEAQAGARDRLLATAEQQRVGGAGEEGAERLCQPLDPFELQAVDAVPERSGVDGRGVGAVEAPRQSAKLLHLLLGQHHRQPEAQPVLRPPERGDGADHHGVHGQAEDGRAGGHPAQAAVGDRMGRDVEQVGHQAGAQQMTNEA